MGEADLTGRRLHRIQGAPDPEPGFVDYMGIDCRLVKLNPKTVATRDGWRYTVQGVDNEMG